MAHYEAGGGVHTITVIRDDSDFEALRRAEIVGRPVGARDFIEGLEKSFDRPLLRQRRGPKVKRD